LAFLGCFGSSNGAPPKPVVEEPYDGGTLDGEASVDSGGSTDAASVDSGGPSVDAEALGQDAGAPSEGGIVASPSPGTCVPTGSMSAGRAWFGIAPLQDGRILVASAGTAEIYNAATGAFSLTGSPIGYPGGPTFFNGNENGLVPLPDGTVLGIGATPSCQPAASAELYDPATNAWSATGSMTTAREFEIPVALANGQVLVMGGYSQVSSCGYPVGDALTSAEIYDPVAKTFSLTGSMAAPRAAGGQVALLLDGRVFVGVAEEGQGPEFNETAEIYTPSVDGGAASGAFALAGTVPGQSHYGYAFTLPNGTVLVGGYSGSSSTPPSFFDPSTASFSTAPADPISWNNGCGVQLKNGDVFLAGGNAGGTITTQTEVYQASSGTWLETGHTSTIRGVCAAAELPNGDVLVAGGDLNGTFLASADVCNPRPPPGTDGGPMDASSDGTSE
jgi:hypothetical protein